MLEDEAQQYIGDVQIADPWDLFPWILYTNELQIKIGLTGTRQLKWCGWIQFESCLGCCLHFTSRRKWRKGVSWYGVGQLKIK